MDSKKDCRYTKQRREATRPDLRMVLLGRSGAGKSSAGNTILGRKQFKSVLGSTAVTQECEASHTERNQRCIEVIDTPDFFSQSLAASGAHIEKCMSMSAPGTHVFLLVLQLGRFTEGERKIVEQIRLAFGPGVTRNMIVLFTYGDDLDGVTIGDFLRNAQPELKALLDQCEERYHVFNNRDTSDDKQVTQLLEKIDTMLEENGGCCNILEMNRESEDEHTTCFSFLNRMKQRVLDLFNRGH
ncbi:GTPase IMAP family member 9 [Amia ocellicauda]|uniref:GTPase IMAP family member 9 n=1 Tax=Amia ocellicauda TaxID=2972642 RepID=UPI003463C107